MARMNKRSSNAVRAQVQFPPAWLGGLITLVGHQFTLRAAEGFQLALAGVAQSLAFPGTVPSALRAFHASALYFIGLILGTGELALQGAQIALQVVGLCGARALSGLAVCAPRGGQLGLGSSPANVIRGFHSSGTESRRATNPPGRGIRLHGHVSVARNRVGLLLLLLKGRSAAELQASDQRRLEGDGFHPSRLWLMGGSRRCFLPSILPAAQRIDRRETTSGKWIRGSGIGRGGSGPEIVGPHSQKVRSRPPQTPPTLKFPGTDPVCLRQRGKAVAVEGRSMATHQILARVASSLLGHDNARRHRFTPAQQAALLSAGSDRDRELVLRAGWGSGGCRKARASTANVSPSRAPGAYQTLCSAG